MIFGYPHCPDVCPTTLAVLAQYAAAFDPSFRALRPADATQLKAVTNDFHIDYERVPGANADDYTMNHTAASLVFDTAGKLRLYVRDGQGVMPWVHDLGELLDNA